MKTRFASKLSINTESLSVKYQRYQPFQLNMISDLCTILDDMTALLTQHIESAVVLSYSFLCPGPFILKHGFKLPDNDVILARQLLSTRDASAPGHSLRIFFIKLVTIGLLYVILGYSTGEFQSLQVIVRAVFGTVDFSPFFKCNVKQLVCKFDVAVAENVFLLLYNLFLHIFLDRFWYFVIYQYHFPFYLIFMSQMILYFFLPEQVWYN